MKSPTSLGSQWRRALELSQVASDTVAVGAVVQATEAEVNPATVMVPLLANLEDRVTRTSPALGKKCRWKDVGGEGVIIWVSIWIDW